MEAQYVRRSFNFRFCFYVTLHNDETFYNCFGRLLTPCVCVRVCSDWPHSSNIFFFLLPNFISIGISFCVIFFWILTLDHFSLKRWQSAQREDKMDTQLRSITQSLREVMAQGRKRPRASFPFPSSLCLLGLIFCLRLQGVDCHFFPGLVAF